MTETETETIMPFTTTTALTVVADGCGTGTPPGLFTFFTGSWCSYTMAGSVTDQNGNQLTKPDLLAQVTNALGTSVPEDAWPLPCLVYVNSSFVESAPGTPGCSIGCGTETDNFQSWTFTLSYPGVNGWAPSTSSAVTLTP